MPNNRLLRCGEAWRWSPASGAHRRRRRLRGLTSGFGLQVPNDLQELLDGPKLPQRLDHSLQVEGHIFVHENVSKPRKPLERSYEIRRESGVAGQVADRPGVILEAIPPPSRKLAGDVDHGLANRKQREKHIAMEREIAV